MMRSKMLMVLLVFGAWPALAAVKVSSPNGQTEALVDAGLDGVLTLAVNSGGLAVVEPSPLGLVVDNVDIGRRVSLGDPKLFVESSAAGAIFGEARPSVPASAENIPATVEARLPIQCQAAKIPVRVEGWDRQEWTLELKVFDNGVAFRYILPFPGSVRLVREVTSFAVPANGLVWFRRDLGSSHVLYENGRPGQLPLDTCARLPVTVELKEGGRLMALAEAGSFDAWSPMTLVPSAGNQLQACHRTARQGWTLATPSASPWRLLLVGGDLDGLMRGSKTIAAVLPLPDARLFPAGIQTEWLLGGRCYRPGLAYGADSLRWDWQPHGLDLTAALGCRYMMLEPGWENPANGWCGTDGQPWPRIRELVGLAEKKGVGLWLAVSYAGAGLASPEKLRAFLDQAVAAGVKGIRIDSIPEVLAPEQVSSLEVLEAAAERRLMVLFHDGLPPAGEAMVWPNEMGRDGAMTTAHNLVGSLPPSHYCTEPFVRGLAGPIDFTPTILRPELLKGTTPAFQVATSAVFACPVQSWGDRAESYLQSPARELLRALPCDWDETRILSASAIGRAVVMARRHGEEWWLAVLNGSNDTPLNLDLPLDFLDPRRDYAAQAAVDVVAPATEAPVSCKLEKNLAFAGGGRCQVAAAPGGGALFVFTPRPLPPVKKGLFGWGFLGL